LLQVGRLGEKASPQLFSWEAFLATDIKTSSEWVGNLVRGATPKYRTDGDDRIKKRLDDIELSQPPGTESGTGLLIYLLYNAARDFCQENYRWKS
jgi:hypothetical protein